jgi:hypothetical protein
MKPEDLHYYQSKLLPHKLELTSDSVIIYCQSAAFPTRSLKIECLRGTLPDYRDENNGEALKECCNTSNNALGKKQTKQDSDLCERSVGTVFQLPDPDAICSQDGKKGGRPFCFEWVGAISEEGVNDGRKEVTRLAA